MTEHAIAVEHLAKRYMISSAHGQRGRYVALRDVLASAVERTLRRVLHPMRAGAAGRSGMQEFWALDDISFAIGQGERLGIIGNNGAGKSTLLKVLSRITEPTRGRIAMRGRVASLLEVGTGFHPELTGRENVYLNGAILGMSRQEIRKKFDEIVAFAEVEQFLDTPVKRYSSGMYVRLAFAVAAHLEPEILIVDEVLAVGDAQFQKKCLGKMEEVGKSGRTVLFVSHNMNAIEQLCDSCMLLHRGKLLRYSRDVRSVVKEYLFGEAEGQKPSLWMNAGDQFDNPFFRPERMFLCNEDGEPLPNPVRNDSDILLHVEGNVAQPHASLALQYTVFCDDGTLLYHSSTIDAADNILEHVRPGRVILRTRIPRRFLNEGDYRIDLTIFLHKVQFITQYGVNAPTLFLSVQGGLTDSPLWTSKRAGLVAPMIPWETIEEDVMMRRGAGAA